MKKINNPFVDIKGYNCFGCSPSNPSGLRMEFMEDGDEVVSIWDPRDCFQGYGCYLHGGIQATLMDEIASWLVFVKCKTAGVTSGLQVRYKHPVRTDQGSIIVKASLKEMRKNIAVVECRIFDADGKICSESEVQYFTYPEEMARDRLRYPGHESFVCQEVELV